MISVSEKASQELKNIMEAQNVTEGGVRVFIQSRCGCGNAHYGMGFDTEIAERDSVLEASGIKIILDEEASELLAEATIDFVETPMSKGFTIDNPNAGGGCACGGGGHEGHGH